MVYAALAVVTLAFIFVESQTNAVALTRLFKFVHAALFFIMIVLGLYTVLSIFAGEPAIINEVTKTILSVIIIIGSIAGVYTTLILRDKSH